MSTHVMHIFEGQEPHIFITSQQYQYYELLWKFLYHCFSKLGYFNYAWIPNNLC